MSGSGSGSGSGSASDSSFLSSFLDCSNWFVVPEALLNAGGRGYADSGQRKNIKIVNDAKKTDTNS